MSAATVDGSAGARERDVMHLLEGVSDPEIPAVSIVDLGIVRYVRCDGDQAVEVGLSPTYSGCPATSVIEHAVVEHLHANGFVDVQVRQVLSPAWTSDWLSDTGREKLREYGIAPPQGAAPGRLPMMPADRRVACPRCASVQTMRVSEFGSTPCKALYRCEACLEPFDYFKCI